MDKNSKWYKKWWVWVIVVVVVFGIIGFVTGGKQDETANNNEQSTETETVVTEEENTNTSETANNNELTEAEKSNNLPEVTPSDYIGQEALVVYHNLANQGYEIELDYANKDNEALYKSNMNLIERMKELDPNDAEDRQMVDAYKVYNVVQLGDHLTIIVK